MSAVLEHDELGAESARGGFGRCERNGILAAVDDQRRNTDAAKRRSEVEVAEAGPDALLDTADDAEGCEVVSACGVGEVPGDTELEGALSVRVRVALAKPRLRELGTKSLYHRALLTPRELGLELLAVRTGDGRGIEQDEGSGSGRSRGNREQGMGNGARARD